MLMVCNIIIVDSDHLSSREAYTLITSDERAHIGQQITVTATVRDDFVGDGSTDSSVYVSSKGSQHWNGTG